jgi:DNA-binding MarR family transcriptional regulator
MTRGLTIRQAMVLTYLRSRPDSPSYREIGAACGIVVSAVNRIMIALEQRGFVEREARRHRSVRLCDPLEQVPTDQLAAELKRRGWRVTAGKDAR